MDRIIRKMDWFKPEEFNCKCGCGLGIADMDIELLGILDAVRWKLGKPIIINSAVRCIEHNLKVGGVYGSSHLNGLAVDIRAIEYNYRYELLSIIMKHTGINRIGIYNTFMHIDVDYSKKERVIWIGE